MKIVAIGLALGLLSVGAANAADEIQPGNYTAQFRGNFCGYLTVGDHNSYTYGPCGGSPEYTATRVKVKYKGLKSKIYIDDAIVQVNEISDAEFKGKFKLRGPAFDVTFLRTPQ